MKSIEALNQGLLLEDFNILVEWDITSQEFLCKIKNCDFKTNKNYDFNYIGYCVKSNVLGLPNKYLVTFNFLKNKLTSVDFSISSPAQIDFETLKNNLSRILGKPPRRRALFSKEGEIYYFWKLKKIIVRLEKIERFGLQEYFLIEVL